MLGQKKSYPAQRILAIHTPGYLTIIPPSSCKLSTSKPITHTTRISAMEKLFVILDKNLQSVDGKNKWSKVSEPLTRFGDLEAFGHNTIKLSSISTLMLDIEIDYDVWEIQPIGDTVEFLGWTFALSAKLIKKVGTVTPEILRDFALFSSSQIEHLSHLAKNCNDATRAYLSQNTLRTEDDQELKKNKINILAALDNFQSPIDIQPSPDRKVAPDVFANQAAYSAALVASILGPDPIDVNESKQHVNLGALCSAAKSSALSAILVFHSILKDTVDQKTSIKEEKIKYGNKLMEMR